MDPDRIARIINMVIGAGCLVVAGMVAGYVFTVHERLYALGVPAIGVLATVFLIVIGFGYSLLFDP